MMTFFKVTTMIISLGANQTPLTYVEMGDTDLLYALNKSFIACQIKRNSEYTDNEVCVLGTIEEVKGE